MDYLKYYDLERYLFEDVRDRFLTDHSIGAFDFFSIIIWKANRAKTHIARKLLSKEPDAPGLEPICRKLTASLYEATDNKERLRLLIKDWRFGLPMSSAILSVCWPDGFTVYDYRVYDRLKDRKLGEFHYLVNLSNFDRLWKDYSDFKSRVATAVPNRSARDQDRYLWGESAALQLKEDIEKRFLRIKS